MVRRGCAVTMFIKHLLRTRRPPRARPTAALPERGSIKTFTWDRRQNRVRGEVRSPHHQGRFTRTALPNRAVWLEVGVTLSGLAGYSGTPLT